MDTTEKNENKTECDEIAIKQLKNSLKTMVKEITEFNSQFSTFLEEQRKKARELWTLVIRYNTINS